MTSSSSIVRSLLIILLASPSMEPLRAFQSDSLLTKSEAIQRLDELEPKPNEFQFHPPQSWTSNLVSGAAITFASEGEERDSAKKLIDNIPYTTWQSNTYDPRPEVVIDLGRQVEFNRIVVFNRCTKQRGTAGGNNATKLLRISVSKVASGTYDSLGTYTLRGPKGVCFKLKGGGQICSFIDDPEPNIITVALTKARFVKLSFQEAFWGEIALKEWKTSVALSEFMLYYANDAVKPK